MKLTTSHFDLHEALTTMHNDSKRGARRTRFIQAVPARSFRIGAGMSVLAATFVLAGAARPAGNAAGAGDPASRINPADVAADTGMTMAMAPSDTITATLSEWAISTSRATTHAGPVVIRVTNNGTMAHRLEVEGKGIEKRTAPIAPGEHVELVVNLAAGGYELYCPLASGAHKKMGMKAEITAEGKKAAGA
jgi:uncharacterized cupredoxin-like copper-binding protein